MEASASARYVPAGTVARYRPLALVVFTPAKVFVPAKTDTGTFSSTRPAVSLTRPLKVPPDARAKSMPVTSGFAGTMMGVPLRGSQVPHPASL